MTREEPEPPEEDKAKWLFRMWRTKIETGEWRDGDRLPSQADLMTQYNQKKRPVRDALIELAHIGRVHTSQGRPARVYMPAKEPHRLVVDLSDPSAGGLELVAEGAPACSFIAARELGEVDERWTDDRFTVPEWDALRLGLDAGTRLSRRILLVSVGGEPVLTCASLVPPDLKSAHVTWWDAPIGELALTGCSTVFDRAALHARVPTLEESERLRTVSGVPVHAVYRRCQVTPLVVSAPPKAACVLIVARADRVHL